MMPSISAMRERGRQSAVRRLRTLAHGACGRFRPVARGKMLVDQCRRCKRRALEHSLAEIARTLGADEAKP